MFGELNLTALKVSNAVCWPFYFFVYYLWIAVLSFYFDCSILIQDVQMRMCCLW